MTNMRDIEDAKSIARASGDYYQTLVSALRSSGFRMIEDCTCGNPTWHDDACGWIRPARACQ